MPVIRVTNIFFTAFIQNKYWCISYVNTGIQRGFLVILQQSFVSLSTLLQRPEVCTLRVVQKI